MIAPPEQSPSIAKLLPALIAARSEYPPLVKDSLNPHHGNQYSSLASVLQACDGPLGRNDLAVLQVPVWSEGALTLFTTLCHTSGEWIRAIYPVLVSEDPQVMGAGLTYARRYSYMTVAGISPADDDGNAAAAAAKAAALRRYQDKSQARTNGANGRTGAGPAPTGWGQPGSFRPSETAAERAAAIAAETKPAPAPVPAARPTNGHTKPSAPPAAPRARPPATATATADRVPVSGSGLYRWACEHEKRNGPGVFAWLVNLGAANGWNEKMVAWTPAEVAEAYAAVTEPDYDQADLDDGPVTYDDGRDD